MSLKKSGDIKPLVLNRKAEEMLRKAESIVKTDLTKASDYISMYLYKHKSKLNQDETFTLFAHAFITEYIAHNQYMFDKSIAKNEQDCILKLWGPLMEKLTQKTCLRLKWDKSSCSILPSCLRADVCVIYDGQEGQHHQEYDMMQMEASRIYPAKEKFNYEHTKLLVEAKDIIDSLEAGIKREMSCIQFCGLELFKYCLTHEFNTLYVNNQVDYHLIPSDVIDFKFMRSLCATMVATRNEWMSSRKAIMNARNNLKASYPGSNDEDLQKSNELKKSPSWYPPQLNQNASPLMNIPLHLH